MGKRERERETCRGRERYAERHSISDRETDMGRERE